MIDPIAKANLYQPKKITIETKPVRAFDEGMPYDATLLTITDETDGKQKVCAEYALFRNSSEELDRIKSVIAEIYARKEYGEPKEETSQESPTPIPGKDFYA